MTEIGVTLSVLNISAMAAILKSILLEQTSALERVVKIWAKEAGNLKTENVKLRRDLEEKGIQEKNFKKREEVMMKLIYQEKCEVSLLKMKLSDYEHKSDYERNIQREVDEYIEKEDVKLSKINESVTGTKNGIIEAAVQRLHRIEQQYSGCSNDDSVHSKKETSDDQNNLTNITTHENDKDDTDKKIPVDDSVIILEDEDQEKVDKGKTNFKPKVEKENVQERELENQAPIYKSLVENLEDILNTDSSDQEETITDTTRKAEGDTKEDDVPREEDLTSTLQELDPAVLSQIMEAEEGVLNLSDITDKFLESLLSDENQELPDTSLLDGSSDVVDVFKLLDSVQKNSADTFDKEEISDVNAPIEINSDSGEKNTNEEVKKRRRGPIREEWVTKKSPRLTLLGKATFTERSTNFSRKSFSAKKKMIGGKIKRTACRKCDNCLREDCGECVNCLDKPKNGGLNRLRQKCLERRCEDMSIYN